MSSGSKKLNSRCAGECSQCSLAEAPAAVPERLAGGRLVLTAAGAFALPLALAIVGAAVFGPGRPGQLLGALGGLAVGVMGGLIVGRLVARKGGPHA